MSGKAKKDEIFYWDGYGSRPTDRIIMDTSTIGRLVEFGSEFDVQSDSTDIIWANQIPVYDCIISFPFGDARVFFVRDTIENFNRELESMEREHPEHNAVLHVGNIVLWLNEGDQPVRVVDLGIKRGVDWIILANIYPHGTAQSNEETERRFSFIYGIWYLVMILLLHPVTKMRILNKAKKATLNTVQRSGKHKRSVIRYVRDIIISDDDLSLTDDTDGEKRKYNVLCWYVSGHWRHYKDGKVVFIKPYWKGELRETKKADETRLREIVTEGVQLC